MTAAPVPEGDHVKESWTCLGRVRVTGGKVKWEWENPAGRRMIFGKVKGQPGRTYEVEVEYGEEGATVVYGEPRWLGSDDPRRLELEARERAELAHHEQLRLEAKDAGESALFALAEPLRAEYRRQVGPARKAAFLAVVIEMVTR